jgi:phosphatidylserine decarboxylase
MKWDAADADAYTRISVFLNIHNVHVQYAPLDGTIRSVVHKPGAFHLAYLFEKGELNERRVTTLDTRIGTVRVVQIAGLVARRTHPLVSPGDRVSQGDSLGLIKFGSRVDLWLPEGFNVLVAPGQRVHIGEALVELKTLPHVTYHG